MSGRSIGAFATATMLIGLSAAAQAQAPAPATPCASDPQFRQMDFTLGHWDVSARGRKNAEVKMERALNGCAVFETWLKPDGGAGAGLGLFTYSRIVNALTYAWVADTGSSTYFTGSRIGPDSIRYVTERPLPNGGKRLRHWTLSKLPDGRIRELSVGTEDGGKTWAEEYDLYWSKHAP